ncbi:hypothetical protein K8354_16725 [Polaribacter litorisediminis]|uniref:hypothetical protein n=1 Tax=Polaribacter litorisediminis TaxID=1908341 RepID=UPI001CBE02FE|nr:hypothetical protein [Polaribacter litorisediminis]UAM97910.1 hypothetical protein K8354_16725 [Polaribacter litorisediminis]
MKKEKLTPKRERFNKKYNEFNESEVQIELLFAQQLTIDKLEKSEQILRIYFGF